MNLTADYYPVCYETSATEWYAAIRSLPGPMLLDSNGSKNEGVDIIAAEPVARVSSEGRVTRVWSHGKLVYQGNACPFSELQALLKGYACPETTTSLPFNGGAIGYFSYDLARRLEKLPEQAVKDIAIPEMEVGVYLWAIVRDHREKTAFFVAHPQCPAGCYQRIMTRIKQCRPASSWNFALTSDFKANRSKQEYDEAFTKIHRYIYAGDCYQVNYAQRFTASYRGDEWHAYLRLRAVTDAPFSAYIENQDYAFLSFSPERFLSVNAQQVEAKPIKGTRPRSGFPQEDQYYAQQLRNSQKDRSENLMIVDLLRNDISKNCLPGSVRVPNLFQVESYTNVHHLVSTVTGRLKPGRDALDLLRDAFPGGSITGAPKRRAMEIIEALEPHRRSLYCGSIGYIDFRGNMDTNICIRTLVCHKQQLYCWGGGGIVADSDVDSEYQESYVKVNNLMSSLRESADFGSSDYETTG